LVQPPRVKPEGDAPVGGTACGGMPTYPSYPRPQNLLHTPLIFRDTSGAAATGVRIDGREGEGRASPWAARMGHSGMGLRFHARTCGLPSEKNPTPRGDCRLTT